MRSRLALIIWAFAIGTIADHAAETPTPPPLLARPKVMYYPHGPDSSPIPGTHLFQAVYENDAREVEALLRRGAKPNELSPPGIPPLIEAMGYQTDPKIADLLLNFGADVNIRTPKNERGQTNNWTPIFYAIYRKRADLVAVLLKHRAKLNIRDVQGKSPADWAKEVKDPAIIKQIIVATDH